LQIALSGDVHQPAAAFILDGDLLVSSIVHGNVVKCAQADGSLGLEPPEGIHDVTTSTSPSTFMAGNPRRRQRKGADMKVHVGATGASTFKHIPRALLTQPGQLYLLSINVDLDYVALLVASLVSFIVFVFVKVPLPGVVAVVRFVILAFAHPLLVPLIFRIVLVLT
jgi:hypothetical protein